MTSQFLSRNYASFDLAADITASSEAQGFPKENLFSIPRRSRVWRSAGWYEFPSGANNITFQEVDGVDIVATFGFLLEPNRENIGAIISQAMTDESGFGANYNITIQSDGRFRISQSGADDFFRLRWTENPFLAEILGFDPLNDTYSPTTTTYDAPNLKLTTGEYFIFDFGVPLNPDAIVVSWRQDETTSIADDIPLLISAATFENDLGTPDFTASAEKTQWGYFIKKADGAEGIASTGYRYWKLQLNDFVNPLLYTELGSIFVGDFIDFSRGKIQIPFGGSWEDGSLKQVTDSGQVISNSKYLTRTFDAEWFGLTKAEKEAFDEFFYEVKTAIPFYIMLDPNSALGSTVERNLVYCHFDAVPSWSLSSPGVYSLSCRLREDL